MTESLFLYPAEDLYPGDIYPEEPIPTEDIANLQTAQSIPNAPTCGFTISPQGPNVSYTIHGTTYNSPYKYTFTNNDISFLGWVKTEPGIFITQYYWDFGDGSQAYGINPHHTYIVAAPEIRATFCVTDNYNRRVCSGQLVNLAPGVAVSVGAYIVRGPDPSPPPMSTGGSLTSKSLTAPNFPFA